MQVMDSISIFFSSTKSPLNWLCFIADCRNGWKSEESCETHLNCLNNNQPLKVDCYKLVGIVTNQTIICKTWKSMHLGKCSKNKIK